MYRKMKDKVIVIGVGGGKISRIFMSSVHIGGNFRG